MYHSRTALTAAVGAPLLWLAACASTPPPTEQMAVADVTLAHAAAAGAAELAPAEMGLARDKMARANQAMLAKDYDTALTLSQQVQVDAQLAEARAEAARAHQSAMALQEASRALHEEMAREKQ
jgi:hypothetical protein